MHSCCAPCAAFPLFLMRSEGYEVDALFVNPNIHPDAEREKRWGTLLDFAGAEGFKALRADVSHDEWLNAVSRDPSRPARCRECYCVRLGLAAKIARQEGYDCFTTSLLVSPYQDHDGIVGAGLEASKAHGIPFMNRDFRPGYKRGREMARGRHMYMQKYCGCEFSARWEREQG